MTLNYRDEGMKTAASAALLIIQNSSVMSHACTSIYMCIYTFHIKYINISNCLSAVPALNDLLRLHCTNVCYASSFIKHYNALTMRYVTDLSRECSHFDSKPTISRCAANRLLYLGPLLPFFRKAKTSPNTSTARSPSVLDHEAFIYCALGMHNH